MATVDPAHIKQTEELFRKLRKKFTEEDKLLLSRVEEIEKFVEKRKDFLPFKTELILNNIDIFLKPLNNALVLSVSALVTTWALNTESVGNIDVDTLRNASLFYVFLFLVCILGLVWYRQFKIDQILKLIDLLYQQDRNINNAREKILLSQSKFEENLTLVSAWLKNPDSVSFEELKEKLNIDHAIEDSLTPQGQSR